MRLLRVRVTLVALLWLGLTACLSAQATRIISSGTLPTTCTVGNIYLKTGTSAGFYVCVTTDTWTGPLATSSGGGGDRIVGITVDGGGSTITTGVKGFITAPISGTITSSTLLSTDSGSTACSVVFDVWKDTFGNYAPTVADTITASAKPTLSSASSAQDTTLTGWTTSVTAGDVIGFNVDSVTGCTRVTEILTVTP